MSNIAKGFVIVVGLFSAAALAVGIIGCEGSNPTMTATGPTAVVGIGGDNTGDIEITIKDGCCKDDPPLQCWSASSGTPLPGDICEECLAARTCTDIPPTVE